MTTQTTTPAPAADQEQPWENLFGVCAAIGEDLGFNPLWLRIALGVSVLFSPIGAAIAYGWMALAVLASRLLVPKRRATPAAKVEPVAAPAPAPQPAAYEPELPLAA